MVLNMIMGHKRERPDYKFYDHNEYALRYAKCALGEELKFKCVWRGDIQEQRGTFEACG